MRVISPITRCVIKSVHSAISHGAPCRRHTLADGIGTGFERRASGVKGVASRVWDAVPAGVTNEVTRAFNWSVTGEKPQNTHSNQCCGKRVLAHGITEFLKEVGSFFRNTIHRTISFAAVLSRCTWSSVTEGLRASPERRLRPITMNATETSAAPPPVNKYATGSESPLRIKADESANNSNTNAGIMNTAPAPIMAAARPA